MKNETATVWSKTDNDKSAQLLDCINNGDIWSIFIQGDYKALPVKNRIVIDIGANIADSSIYFALDGAERTIALEPFMGNYEVAKKNVEKNNLAKTITLLLAGSGGTTIIINSPAVQQTTLQDSFTDETQIP
jgi:ribosomal protein L11 methylase PrmA